MASLGNKVGLAAGKKIVFEHFLVAIARNYYSKPTEPRKILYDKDLSMLADDVEVWLGSIIKS